MHVLRPHLSVHVSLPCPPPLLAVMTTVLSKRMMIPHNKVCDNKCTSKCTYRNCPNSAAKAKQRAVRARHAQLAGFQAPEDEQLVAMLKEGMEENGMNV
jgi:hypothetical protein